MELRTLQTEVNARWGSQDTNLCHTSDANHALVHMTKALGKIAAAVNDAEHEGGRKPTAEETQKYLADLIICAVRFADGIVDVDAACTARLAEKFPAKWPLPTSPAEVRWAVERADRLDVAHSPELRERRKVMLLKVRANLEFNFIRQRSGGHHRTADDTLRRLDAVDGELAALDRVEQAIASGIEQPWSRDD